MYSGQSCTYRCDQGYLLVGESTVTCLDNGEYQYVLDCIFFLTVAFEGNLCMGDWFDQRIVSVLLWFATYLTWKIGRLVKACIIWKGRQTIYWSSQGGMSTYATLIVTYLRDTLTNQNLSIGIQHISVNRHIINFKRNWLDYLFASNFICLLVLFHFIFFWLTFFTT